MKKFTIFSIFLFMSIVLFGNITKTINCSAGKLSSLISNEEKQTLTNLTITGIIDARDFRFMRDELPLLSELDISAVTINAYTGFDGSDVYSSTTVYDANKIPVCAFNSPKNQTWNERLKKVILPINTIALGSWSFYQCSGIQSLKIPSSVRQIDAFALHSTKLDSLFISSSVTLINYNALLDEGGYIQVDPNNVNYSSIDGVLFDKSATKLIHCPTSKEGSYNMPTTVSQIGVFAFAGCKELKEVIISPNVKSIDDSNFSNCTKLKSVTLPSTLTHIRYGAFYGCESLENINIPNTLVSIGGFAFGGCTNLKAITIPASVLEIDQLAFNRGTISFDVNENNPNFSSFEGSLYNKTKTILYQYSNAVSGNFIVPSTVKTIDVQAFMNCEPLKTVVFPFGLEEIKRNAFLNCTALESVEFPSSLKNIEDYAFGGCKKFSTLSIPEGVESIGQHAFSQCYALETIYANSDVPVNISSSPDVFYGVLFSQCILFVPSGSVPAYRAASQWKDFPSIFEMPLDGDITTTEVDLAILIPKNVRDTLTTLTIKGAIDARDFKFMRDSLPMLAVLDMKEAKVTAYKGIEGTFLNATADFYYPANEIPTSAFYKIDTYNGKQSLKSVILPKYVTSIGSSAFSKCSNLNSVTFSSALRIINTSAFNLCKSLNGTISIPSTVEKIDGSAFQGCNGISDITIPSSVTFIGQHAFMSFNGNIVVDKDNPNYLSIDGVLFNKEKTHLMQCSTSKTGSYVLPSTVLTLERYAFADCSNLTSISLTSNITFLPDAVFNNCSGLKEMKIPSSVTTINNSAFNGCKGLTSVTIPSSVKAIDNLAFFNCIALRTIYVNTILPVDISSSHGIFYGINKTTCILYVPVGSVPAYRAANQWKDFENIVEMPSYPHVTSTAGGLALHIPKSSRATLTNLTISGIIDARDFRFMRDSLPMLAELDIENVTINAYSGTEGTVTSTGNFDYPANAIPANAFYNVATGKGSTNLVSVKLANSIVLIGREAFSNCFGLKEIKIPEHVTLIGTNAFMCCKGLINIDIPSSVLSIEDNAFVGCSGLFTVDDNNPNFSSVNEVIFNKTKTNLIQCLISKSGDYSIPSTVTSIRNNAFSFCVGLATIKIPPTVKIIETGVFLNCIGLIEMVIPTSISAIERSTFAECSKLGSVVIPSSVSSIGDFAFGNCTSLTSIIENRPIPVDLTSSSTVFDGVNKTTCTLYVPFGSAPAYRSANQWKDFENIVEMLFGPHVTSTAGGLALNIPKSVRDTLTNLTISGIIDARDFRFMRDSLPMLTELDIKDVTIAAYSGTDGTGLIYQTNYEANAIPGYAFGLFPGDTSGGKRSIKKVILPLNITSIGRMAFQGCTNLQELSIPESVTTIRESAFSICPSLKNINIPSKVKIIEKSAFCPFLGEFIVDINNPYFSSLDGILFNYDRTILIQCPVSKSGEYTIPSTVKTIGGYAFRFCTKIEIKEIPSSVSNIEEFSFSLSQMFKMGKIEIPKSVKFYGRGVFEGTMLNTIIVRNASPIDLSQSPDVFKVYDKTACTLYVPFGSKVAYQTANQWKDFQNIVEMPLVAGDLSNCIPLEKRDTLTSLSITGTMDARDFKFIRDNLPLLKVIDLKGVSIVAYSGNEGTTDGQNIEYLANTIPAMALANKTSIIKIVFPDSITAIDKGAFEGCTKLSDANLPAQVSSIGEKAFFECSNFGPITIPTAVGVLDSLAFVGCSGPFNVDKGNAHYSSDKGVLFNKDQKVLVQCPTTIQGNFTLPKSVQEVNTMAFYNCRQIDTLTIPEFVQNIEEKSFYISGCFIKVEEKNTVYTSVNGTLYNKAKTTLLYCSDEATGNFSVPPTVNTIKDFSFANCSLLEKIELPASVATISDGAFTNCSGLTQLKTYSLFPADLSSSNKVFTGVNTRNCVLRVPFGSKEQYQASMIWKDFEKIEEMPGTKLINTPIDTIDNKGGSINVEISSNTNWKAFSTENWVQLKPTENVLGNGLLTISLPMNLEFEPRTASLRIISEEADTIHFEVNQKAGEETLIVPMDTLFLGNDANSRDSINVLSNIYWVASSNQTWLTLNPATAVKGSANIEISAAQNKGYERMATVTIKSTIGQRTITVVQESGIPSKASPLEAHKINIFPNPMEKNLGITGAEGLASYQLIDVTGKVVLKGEFRHNISLETDWLKQGIYLLKVFSQSGIQEQRVVKK